MKNLKADFQEKALDDILQYAAKEAGEQINKEFNGMNEIDFSKEHTERMEKLFKSYRRREQLYEFRKYAGRIAAIFVLVAVLTTGISVFSVQAWRTKFLNFVLNITESNMEINYNESEQKNSIYSSNYFDMNYIPEGYSLSSRNEMNNMIFLLFKNNTKEFSLQMQKKPITTNMDNEDAIVKELIINNNVAYLTQENGKYSLAWNDNTFSYILYGDESESELIKIAENVIAKNNF